VSRGGSTRLLFHLQTLPPASVTAKEAECSTGWGHCRVKTFIARKGEERDPSPEDGVRCRPGGPGAASVGSVGSGAGGILQHQPVKVVLLKQEGDSDRELVSLSAGLANAGEGRATCTHSPWPDTP
jgi:hypothetical protein